MKRYHVDAMQAQSVHNAALTLFKSLSADLPDSAQLTTALGWAADLHEVGISIAHNAYHRHSAYILENADMPGFSRVDQQLLALLVLGHQGKVNKLEPLVRTRGQWLAMLCLRLATQLARRREKLDNLPLSISVKDQSIVLRADAKWLATHPLSDFTLRAEEQEWTRLGFKFELLER